MLNNDNEQYVQSCITEMNEWNNMHADELISLRASINQFLSTNTENSIYTLCTFLNDKTIITTFLGVSDIAYCILAADMTAYEFNMHSQTPKFMYNTLNIDNLIHKLQCCRFLILNIEYDVDRNNAIDNIIKAINDQYISVTALARLILNIAVNKALVIDTIIKALNTADMSENATMIYSTYKNMEKQL